MMGVTIVLAFNSIKGSGIGGVANNPVVMWILRVDAADSISGKRHTFLAEDFLIKSALQETSIYHCILPNRHLQARLH